MKGASKWSLGVPCIIEGCVVGAGGTSMSPFAAWLQSRFNRHHSSHGAFVRWETKTAWPSSPRCSAFTWRRQAEYTRGTSCLRERRVACSLVWVSELMHPSARWTTEKPALGLGQLGGAATRCGVQVMTRGPPSGTHAVARCGQSRQLHGHGECKFGISVSSKHWCGRSHPVWASRYLTAENWRHETQGGLL